MQGQRLDHHTRGQKLNLALNSHQPVLQSLTTPVDCATYLAPNGLAVNLHLASILKENAGHISAHIGATMTS
jgi:hypothetical protein